MNLGFTEYLLAPIYLHRLHCVFLRLSVYSLAPVQYIYLGFTEYLLAPIYLPIGFTGAFLSFYEVILATVCFIFNSSRMCVS